MTDGLNEIQESEQLKDLEMLKRIEPSWRSAGIEPFIPPVDSDVRNPVWGKAVIVNRDPSSSDDSGGSGGPGNVRVICAAWNGSTFVPQIMIPPAETIFQDP